MRNFLVFFLGIVVGLGMICLLHNWNHIQGYFENNVQMNTKECNTCTVKHNCKDDECAENCPGGECCNRKSDKPKETAPMMPPAKD